jgi:energy-coupling factor transporter ATP-binding protein EcfA2
MEIVVENLNFSYSNKRILKNINFKIKSGEFVGLVGHTGCGKTTLAYCLNGLIPNSISGKFSGQVKIDGLDSRKNKVSEIAKKVGFVFQDPDWQIFSLTLRDEVEFGLNNLGLKNVKKRVKNALKTVNLDGRENEEPNQLSQGQRQKLCIASILATDPELIILDEPTSQLDFRNSKNIHEILKKLNKEGKTIFLIEHDTDFLSEYCDRILVMNDGKIIKDDKTKKVFSDIKLLKKIGIKIPRCFK